MIGFWGAGGVGSVGFHFVCQNIGKAEVVRAHN